MQFTADGPDIPIEILQAHEEGTLAFICGAGISMPALPSFKSLLEKAIESLGRPFDSLEQLEYERENFDRTFALLERATRYGRQQVRKTVQEILEIPPNTDLRTHSALLSLARNRHERLHLVTTNFDLLFEQAAGDPVSIHSAPVLPVPKPHKWDALVHLHGRIDHENDPDGEHLVLSATDFGTAYLTEQWAARFLTELFNHFTVVFVGYSANDPVMRYLLDALAGERLRDGRIGSAYAFADYSSGSREQSEEHWRARGVIPMFYSHDNGHSALHDTLRQWAVNWRDGLHSKMRIVATLGTNDPKILPPHEISRVCWAVAESDGSIAKAFARLPERPPFGWADVFEKAGLLQRPASKTPTPAVLVDQGQTHQQRGRIDPVSEWLSYWLASYHDDPQMLRWVLNRGRWFHPHFAATVRLLVSKSIQEQGAMPLNALQKLWLFLTGSDHSTTDSQYWADYSFEERLNNAVDSGCRGNLRAEFLAACRPYLRLTVRQDWYREYMKIDEKPLHELYPTDLVEIECVLRGGQFMTDFVESIRQPNALFELVGESAFELTMMLKRVLDLRASLDDASESEDYTYMDRPSIEPHTQNENHRSWTVLIQLLCEAINSLSMRDSRQARALVTVWCGIKYPLFRRMVLYAAKALDILDASEVLREMRNAPEQWLWAPDLQLELLRYLPKMWEELSTDDRIGLGKLLVDGPERSFYRNDLSVEEWEELQDHLKWTRLATMASSSLTEELTRLLAEIEVRHPTWELTGDEREIFTSWIESSFRDSEDGEERVRWTPEDTDDTIIQRLNEQPPDRHSILAQWREFVTSNPDHGIRIMRRLIKDGNHDSGVWSYGFRGMSSAVQNIQCAKPILAALNAVPEGVLRVSTHAATDVVEQLAKVIAKTEEDELLREWDRLLAAIPYGNFHRTNNPVQDAANHPIGNLIEALLHLLRLDNLTQNVGLPEHVALRFERTIGSTCDAILYPAIATLFQYLRLIDYVDRPWMKRALLPLFDLSRGETARVAWFGYLYRPWITPQLWLSLKKDFLETVKHPEAFGEAAHNLSSIVAHVAVQIEDGLTTNEARDCLRSLGDTGRRHVIHALKKMLNDAQADSGTLWAEHIAPWINNAWPKDQLARGPETSTAFSWMALGVQPLFSEIVATVRPFLQRRDDVSTTMYQLSKMQEESPLPAEAVLTFLDAIVGDRIPYAADTLRQCLDRVIADMPSLRTDARYVRLHEVAVRHE